MAGDNDNALIANLIRIIHILPLAYVFWVIATRREDLASAEAGENLLRFGPNALQKIKGKPLYLKFLANFTHLMAILLWVGGIIAFIAQMPQLGVAVWIVNIINGLFSFWQEYRAEKATEVLLKLLPHQVRVVWEGKEQVILSEGLVPGDLILIMKGDHISADARLVQVADLKIDPSTLTGESHPVRKTSEIILLSGLSRIGLPNLVFAGTDVVSGTGKAVVFATGMESEFGKLAHLTQSLEEEQSPLQKELNHVTLGVTIILICVGLLFFVLMVTLTGVTLAESFIFGLGMIVALVPEGTIQEYAQPIPPAVVGDLRSLLIAAGLCNNARLLPSDMKSSHGRLSAIRPKPP